MTEQEAKESVKVLRDQLKGMETWGSSSDAILLQTQVKMLVVVLSSVVALMEKSVAEKWPS